MKKKVLALILFAAMAVSLMACGSSEQPKGTVAEVTETSAAETTAAETSEEETGAFEMGTTSNLVYENSYIGIGCKLPEGWTTYDEEQIAELNGIILDNIDESVKDQIENASYLYDLMATAPDTPNNMNIIVQKLSLLQSAAANDMEQALQAAEEDLKTALGSMGATNIEFRIDRGQEFPVEGYACGVVSAEIQGSQLTERLVMFKKGGYLVNVTVAAFGEDVTEDLLSGFYALD